MANNAAHEALQRRIKKHIDNLGSSDEEVSARAEGYLIRYYGAKALEELIEASADPNAQVRFRAGWALGYTYDSRAFDTILRLTQDPDGFVRYDAAIALGILGDERGILPLITLWQEPDDIAYVDSAAAMGLVRMGSKAVPALLEVLERSTGSDRRNAAWVLGSIGDARAIEPLKALLASPDEEDRTAGIDALEQIGESRILV